MPNQQDTVTIPLDVLLDALDTPTVLVDRNYRIRSANRAYCAAYGVTATEVAGRTCHEVSHGSDQPCHLHGENCPHQTVFTSGASCDVEHRHRLPGDQLEIVSIRAHLVHDHEGTPFLMETVTQHSLPCEVADEDRSLRRIEAEVIRDLLRKHLNRREIAEKLGISERTLYRKLNKYALLETEIGAQAMG